MNPLQGGTGETSKVTVVRNGRIEVLCEAGGGTGGYYEQYEYTPPSSGEGSGGEGSGGEGG